MLLHGPQYSFFAEPLVAGVPQIRKTIREENEKIAAVNGRAGGRVIGRAEHPEGRPASGESFDCAIRANQCRFEMPGVRAGPACSEAAGKQWNDALTELVQALGRCEGLHQMIWNGFAMHRCRIPA